MLWRIAGVCGTHTSEIDATLLPASESETLSCSPPSSRSQSRSGSQSQSRSRSISVGPITPPDAKTGAFAAFRRFSANIMSNSGSLGGEHNQQHHISPIHEVQEPSLERGRRRDVVRRDGIPIPGAKNKVEPSSLDQDFLKALSGSPP